MSFRLIPNLMTLNDLERRNSANRSVISPNSIAFRGGLRTRNTLGDEIANVNANFLYDDIVHALQFIFLYNRLVHKFRHR